jgi:hypothetical protein
MVEPSETAALGWRERWRRRRSRPPRAWVYRNLTPWRIYACYRKDGSLVPGEKVETDEESASVWRVLSIPALGEIRMPHDDAEHLDTVEFRRRGQLDVRPAPSEFWSALPSAIVSFGWLAVGLFFGCWALLFGGWSAVPWNGFVVALVAVAVIGLAVATAREVHLYRRFGHYRTEYCKKDDDGGRPRSLEGISRGSRFRTFVDGLPRQALETTVLIGAVLIAVVGLGVAIHNATQLDDLMPMSFDALLGFDGPFAVSELAGASPAFSQLLVGHVAQWILVAIAALTPAAMYFQFDRQRLAAVQRCWVQEVFRLDPTVRTVGDIEAKYGSQIEASFGFLAPDSSLRLRGGRRSPVIVATILLVVGWFLIISTTRVPAVIADGGELVWTTEDGSFPVAAFFSPDLSLVGYAFLGSYVFTLFHVIRGYQRRDLHPKTYNTVVVRILSAYVVALVVGVMYTGPAAEVIMFFVGFMPQSALVWLREKLSQSSGPWRVLPLNEPMPLTELEGIDLYDRTRLAEEGVNNVEALAHADIVSLMSSTRISAAELVDWVDQAILYLRVGGDAAAHRVDEERRGEDAPPPTAPPIVRDNLSHLRTYGIRTASDLLQAYDQAIRRGGGDRDNEQDEVEALRAALELPSKPADAPISTIQTVIDTLPDEEWFTQVRNWRNPEFGAADAWYRYLDGSGWTPRVTNVPGRIQRAKQSLRAYPMVAAEAEEPGPPATEIALVTDMADPAAAS